MAQPFDSERTRREKAIKLVLKSHLGEKYHDNCLRVGDNEPKEALFCDICREIQSSEYGIIDITSLNPNVLVELGIMLALGKPISVLFKKKCGG